MAAKSNEFAIQTLKKRIRYACLNKQPLESDDLLVISVHRYLCDPKHMSQSGCRHWDTVDVLQLTLADTKHKMKVILAPELNRLVQRNKLQVGHLIVLTKCRLHYDEQDLSGGCVVIVDELRTVGHRIIHDQSEVADLAWCNDSSHLEQIDIPLTSSRGYFVSVWSTMEMYGPIWKTSENPAILNEESLLSDYEDEVAKHNRWINTGNWDIDTGHLMRKYTTTTPAGSQYSTIKFNIVFTVIPGHDTDPPASDLIKMLRFSPSKFDDSQTDDVSFLMTPPGKGDHSMADTPSQTGFMFPTSQTLDGSYTEITRRPLGRFFSFGTKRSLFSGKRLADHDDVDDLTPVTKKLREAEPELDTFSLESPEQIATSEQHIRSAVNRLSTEADLLADGSGQCRLPTVPGRHSDLKSISADTISDVMRGCYDETIDHVTIIDCRYPYEYEGGHIEGAINLYTRDGIQSFLTQHSLATTSGSHVLIFHCEFSAERGPKMCRFLRNQDRKLNKDNYPALNFPEVYLLHGGYKAFFGGHKTQCEPATYKPMVHADHADDLRKFRVKSKSWSAGEKRRVSRVTLTF